MQLAHSCASVTVTKTPSTWHCCADMILVCFCRVAAQCSIVAVVIYYATGSGNITPNVLVRPPGVAEGDCKHYNYTCHVKHLQIGLVGIMVAFPVLYFLVFSFFLRQAFVQLRQQPYADFKIGNLVVRLKVCDMALSSLYASCCCVMHLAQLQQDTVHPQACMCSALHSCFSENLQGIHSWVRDCIIGTRQN